MGNNILASPREQLVVSLAMPHTPENTEPFVQAACIAQSVVIDGDGVPTLVRIIDTFNVTEPPEMGGLKPAAAIEGIISVKSGAVKGSFPLEGVLRAPNGNSQSVGVQTLTLEGGIHGMTVKLLINVLGIQYGEPYWLDILWGEKRKLLTSIPFRFLRTNEPPKVQTLSA